MPIQGHFARPTVCLSMPRRMEGVVDDQGFACYGEVLTGQQTVRQRFAAEEARQWQRMSPPRLAQFADPRDYDPVLKFHLRVE